MLNEIKKSQIEAIFPEVQLSAGDSAIALWGFGWESWVTFNALKRASDGMWRPPEGAIDYTGVIHIESCVVAMIGQPDERTNGLGIYEISEIHDSPWIGELREYGIEIADEARHIAVCGHDESCQFICYEFSLDVSSKPRNVIVADILK